MNGAPDFADWLAESNTRTMAIAMVETRQAFDCLDGILETPGIDGVFVGPSDFSIAWSGGRTVDTKLEDMMEAIAEIGRRTREAGKAAAIFVVDPKITGRYAKMGFQLFATGSEPMLIRFAPRTSGSFSKSGVAAILSSRPASLWLMYLRPAAV